MSNLTTKKRNQILAINAQIRTLRATLKEALESGTASASLSTAGNSQTYTRTAPTELRKEIAMLERAKAQILSSETNRRTSPDFGN